MTNLHRLMPGGNYPYLPCDPRHCGHGGMWPNDYDAVTDPDPGRWFGSGLASLHDSSDQHPDPQLQRLQIVIPGSPVDNNQLTALFGHGAHPNAPLIARYLAERGADPATQTRAVQLGPPTPQHATIGYGLTFAPVASVVTLWAVADDPLVDAIEQAHANSVLAALTYLERHATLARTGVGSVAQIDVDGLIAAVFTYRVTPDGSPGLRTHTVISAKVCAHHYAGRRWTFLDTDCLEAAVEVAAEIYTSQIEADLTRLGFRFSERGL